MKSRTPLTVLVTLALTGLLLVGSGGSVSAASLPQDHEYQRTLRSYLATLAEKDFALEIRNFTVPEQPPPPSELYRLWTFTMGGAYGYPRISGVTVPAVQFTLAAMEAQDAVGSPAAESLPLAWLATWKYPGNPYFGSRALKRRAFVRAAVDMMMLDAVHEKSPGSGANRSDYLGGTLIWLAYTHGVMRDELPAEVRVAYETGLRKFVARLEQWGPTGAMTDMDLFAPVGLKYAANALGDPQIERAAKAYADRLFTDPRYFHPAGYFVDVKAFDVSYNGISLFFNAWAALLSDWPSAREALTKAYRLKNHLTLPEPDGIVFFGPTHLSSRTSDDSPHDQWNWPHRNMAAALVTDEAMFTVPLPASSVLSQVPAQIASSLNWQLATATPQALSPWEETHWTKMNIAYEFFNDGFYERRAKCEAEKSWLLQPVFKRPDNFIRAFEKTFLVAKFDRYGVILHTGVVSPERQSGDRLHGFGGGTLSAFWTPATGSVILGRRRGFQGDKFDTYDEWRLWPTHAISGATADGKVISSARTESPDAQYELGERSAVVRVTGAIPSRNALQGKTLQGQIKYERTFTLKPGGLQVQTIVNSDGRDRFAELYETIPIFFGDALYQPNLAPPAIRFKAGRQWVEATPEPLDRVEAIRVERCGGSIEITFRRPQRVQLSPAVWQDQYQSRATCRNILVDLLGATDRPSKVRSTEVRYQIAPLGPKPPAP